MSSDDAQQPAMPTPGTASVTREAGTASVTREAGRASVTREAGTASVTREAGRASVRLEPRQHGGGHGLGLFRQQGMTGVGDLDHRDEVAELFGHPFGVSG